VVSVTEFTCSSLLTAPTRCPLAWRLLRAAAHLSPIERDTERDSLSFPAAKEQHFCTQSAQKTVLRAAVRAHQLARSHSAGQLSGDNGGPRETRTSERHRAALRAARQEAGQCIPMRVTLD